MTLRKLEPKFYGRVWGSKVLEPWFPNPDLNSDSNNFAGKKPDPIGEVWFQTEDIPLLIKFLFTTENLSVQVHPNDEYAAEHHQSRGKTEMWHVLAAEPGAKIAAGFKNPVSREEAHAAALSGEIEELLEWHPAKPGDTFFIPAGTVHAIGAGLTICEIQQLSDITYRLYDYGRGRELHLEHGMKVSQLGPHDARSPLPVSCEHFITERLSVISDRAKAAERGELAIIIRGEGTLNGEPTRAGDVWQLLPGSQELRAEGDLEVLRTSV